MDLRDSSDFRQAIELMRALSGAAKATPVVAPEKPPPASKREPERAPSAAGISEVPPEPPSPKHVPSGGVESEHSGGVVETEPAAGVAGARRYISDELSDILREMCRRGEFSGAVVADDAGLPVADFNCPMDPGTVSACGSVLGDTMRRAGRLLNQQETNNISMDVGYVDKVTVRRFEIEGVPYFLIVLCPRSVDERKEIQVAINRIVGVLGTGDRGAGGGFSQIPTHP